MRRFHRAIPEVLLHPEEVDPTLGYREANHHVFARYLAQFSGCKTRHENVCSQLHLITRKKKERSNAVSSRKLAACRKSEKNEKKSEQKPYIKPNIYLHKAE